MKIDTLDLGTDLYRENRGGDSRVDGRMVRSLDNTPLVWEQAGGLQAFDIVGGENIGTLTWGRIKEIQALAAMIGGEYTIEYDTTTLSARFRTWEQPVVEYVPIGDRESLQDSDICKNIKIKLMEVST